MKETTGTGPDRFVECDGHHYAVVNGGSSGGDLAIDLDADDTLFISEECSDNVLRGVIRFGAQQHARGREEGRIGHQFELARLLGVTTTYAFESLRDAFESLRESVDRQEDT